MAIGDIWPVSMLLRIYSLSVLFMDLSYFVFYTTIEIFHAVWRIFMPLPCKDVRAEIAVIVGAARGIGRELSLEMAARGAVIVCLDINSDGNYATVEKIRLKKGRAHAFQCDVTNKAAVMRTIQTVEKQVGPISFLMHCYGIPSPRSYTSDVPAVKDTIDVSVVSHFWLLESVLPKMKRRQHGHVVFLTSVAGIKDQMALSVSQFAVQGLYKSLTENLCMERLDDIIVSLVHVYPFIVSQDLAHDIALRIPNHFGTIDAGLAATKIVDSILRNETEFSIPKHVLYLGSLLRLLPARSTFMLRTILDTGLDFG